MPTQEDLLNRISIDPRVCFGKPCIAYGAEMSRERHVPIPIASPA